MFSSACVESNPLSKSAVTAPSNCLVMDEETDDELEFFVQANVKHEDDDTTLSLLSFSEGLGEDDDTYQTDNVFGMTGPNDCAAAAASADFSIASLPRDVDVFTRSVLGMAGNGHSSQSRATVSPLTELLFLEAVDDLASCEKMSNDAIRSPTCFSKVSESKPKRSKRSLHRDIFPMARLPDDLICQVGSFLNVGSLKMARLTCRRFHRVLSRDEAGWKRHCYTLWNRRVHICPDARRMLESSNNNNDSISTLPSEPESISTSSGPKLGHDSISRVYPRLCESAIQAYRHACMDARLRHEIRPEEFLFDPERPEQGTVWSFRFKKAAGSGWTAFDPWHAGDPAREMVFLPNGRVMQLVRLGARPDTDGFKQVPVQRGSFELRQPFFDAGVVALQQHQHRANPSGDGPGIEMFWRHVSQPIDLPKRSEGAYIRLRVGGRDVPTYLVHRSPNGNWGWLVENCWGVFANFSLNFPKEQQTDETLAIENTGSRQALGFSRVRMRLRRDSNGDGRWLNVSGIESETDDDDDDDEAEAVDAAEFDGDSRPRKRRRLSMTSWSSSCSSTASDLLDDSSLTVTTRWQWREALLYNLGAVSLPDGPDAVTQFEREWRLPAPTIR